MRFASQGQTLNILLVGGNAKELLSLYRHSLYSECY